MGRASYGRSGGLTTGEKEYEKSKPVAPAGTWTPPEETPEPIQLTPEEQRLQEEATQKSIDDQFYRDEKKGKLKTEVDRRLSEGSLDSTTSRELKAMFDKGGGDAESEAEYLKSYNDLLDPNNALVKERLKEEGFQKSKKGYKSTLMAQTRGEQSSVLGGVASGDLGSILGSKS